MNPATIFFVHLNPLLSNINPNIIDTIGSGNQHQNIQAFLVKLNPCCGLISSIKDNDHNAPHQLHIVAINNIIIRVLINLVFFRDLIFL